MFPGKEVKKPRLNVPRAMIFAVVLNSAMQFVWLLVVLYRFGDPDVVANAPGGVAIIGVYMNATNSKALTTLFVFFQLFILFVSLFNIFASVARLTWAFSQNNGLPLSRYFSYVRSPLPCWEYSLWGHRLDHVFEFANRQILAGLGPLAYASSLSYACRGHLLPSIPNKHWERDSIQRSNFPPSHRHLYQLLNPDLLPSNPQTSWAHAEAGPLQPWPLGHSCKLGSRYVHFIRTVFRGSADPDPGVR